VNYCKKQIRQLKAHKITPIFVFDGDRLPMKRDEEIKRSEAKRSQREKAQKLIEEGRKEEADKKLKASISITSAHAFALIEYLIEAKITYYVAPYEADAQLAYLYHQGIIDMVFTEDSDLLAYGVKHVVFKRGTQGNFPSLNQISYRNQLEEFIRYY
jgi:exonuclease 1